MGVCFGIRANRIADGLSVWEGRKSAQSRNSQVAACSTWVHGEASSFHLGMGEEERSGKKYLCSKSLPEAKVRPPYLYRETGVWPALWGRGSNDPGNVAKTHYLPHNSIGHLATVLREDLQVIGPLLHPVLLVRVKVCLL